MTRPPRPPRHASLELLSRYRAILAAAWAVRHELAGPKRLADEAAFLPAALSLQETPVHPAPRRAMWLIMALLVVVLAWSIVGQVDIVAVAPGRIVVSDRTKLIQPLEAGVVAAIRVKDGDHVQAGQVLVELDATGVRADSRNVQEQLLASTSEALRSAALLVALQAGLAPHLPAKADPRIHTLLNSEWGDIAAKSAKLDAELARREAELATATELLNKLNTTVPLARQREEDFKSLSGEGFISGHAGQDRSRERIELERDLATQQARVTEARAVLVESRNTKAAYLAETQRTLNDRHAQASTKRIQLTQEGRKADQKERLTQLTAPVAGTVQQLAIHTTGGVVTPAQQLMIIVPDGAHMTAEVVIENKDIGFVQAGQAAEVKLETFSFTRYGTVPASVIWVTADAVVSERPAAGGMGAPNSVATFPATLKLERAQIDIDGKMIRLAPGMSLSAEIKTGRRSVIDFVLSPIKQRVSESLRER